MCSGNYKLILDTVFFSLIKDVVSVAIDIVGIVSAAAATVDIATGAAVANNDAIDAVVPPTLTKDASAYVGT